MGGKGSIPDQPELPLAQLEVAQGPSCKVLLPGALQVERALPEELAPKTSTWRSVMVGPLCSKQVFIYFFFKESQGFSEIFFHLVKIQPFCRTVQNLL